MMQGRGRGSYLGLLLESSVGKSMVGSVSSSVSDEKKQGEVEDTRISSPQTVNGVGSTTSDASPKCTPSPGTWTSLDLLGNRGRRGKHGKEVLAEQSSQEQVKIKENENHTNSIAKDIETVHPVVTILTEAKRSSPAPVDGTTQRPSSLSLLHDVSSKEVHLSSPQDFMIPSTKITGNEKEEIIAEGRSLLDTEQPDDSSSDTCGSNSSSSSRYIPPHRRKGLDGKPEISCEKAVSENKRNDVREVKRQDLFAMNQEPCSKKQEPCLTSEAVDPQKLVESELNWQKWKLQRNFKKMLNSLAIDNALGLSKDIREMIVNSQLSTKFPGVSEVNVILELLVGRVLDEKEPIEVAVQVCRLLNAMYPHELPSNLREVLKEFRKDIFAGVANKNSRCDNFCLFLGKLCDVGKLETKSFQDCLRQSVIGCLYEWISPYQSVDENSHEAQIKVVYLCELLELTKNVMTTAKRSWVKSCFGKVKNCILSDKLPRGVKESLLDAIIRLLFHSPTSAEAVVDGKLSGEVDNSRLPTAGEPRGTDLQLPGLSIGGNFAGKQSPCMRMSSI